jgi:hypothetical protein
MNPVRQVVCALVLALGMGSLLAAPALAWDGRLEGRPENLHPGSDLGYYIWHDGEGLHLRTIGPGPRHVFKATLRTDGEFRNVRLVRLEGDDGFEIRDGGHVLELRFETWDGIDGVDFHIEGGKKLTFLLRLDGARAPTRKLFLGAAGVHPRHNPFVIKR